MENQITRNDIIAAINALQAQLVYIETTQINTNAPILVEETLNLIDGVGEGYCKETHWAPARYYSRIEGVKNLRMWRDEVVVKLLDKRGYDLPETIEVRGKKYRITFTESKNFTEEVLD